VKIRRKLPTEPQYAFVGLSLGDCKVYRISMRTGKPVVRISVPCKCTCYSHLYLYQYL
jgi:hypothetical protein